jgi:hypothetical protein
MVRIIGILLLAYLGWVTVVQLSRRTFSPPDDARTLGELSRAGEPIVRLARVTVGGQSFYVWLGRTLWQAAPSGPACYVFDSRGSLVAFSPTTGDGELFQYCDAAWRAPEVSVEKALADAAAKPQ